MFKEGDLVRYTNANSRWNGTLWRAVRHLKHVKHFYLTLEQNFLGYKPGYKATIAASMLQLERERGSFGKWFKEHSK